MKIRSLQYYVREAIRSLIKNRLMTVAAVVTLASCIFMVTISFCLVSNVDHMMKKMEDSVSILVIVSDNCDSEGVNSLYTQIGQIPRVKGIRFISKEEALQQAREDWDDTEGILDGLETDNPLSRSFEIEVEDIRYQSEVIRALEGMKAKDIGIEKVNHGKDVTDILMTVTNVLRVVCVAIILGLAAISVVIITNTIKITVNTRKAEINIMKYVGATDAFIRGPFVIEGMLIGIIGSLIPVFISWAVYGKVIEMLKQKLEIVKDLIQFQSSFAIFPELVPIALVVGVLIGAIGSVASMRKHLKV